MAEGGELGIGARLAIGGIAGLIGAAALASTVRRLSAKPPPGAPRDLFEIVAPFALGAACGALLAAANARPGRATGALAGGGLWLASEMGWLPAMTVRPAPGGAVRRGVIMLAGHVAWGWSAATTIRELGDAAAS